jgi:transcriptional regulator with XRE-family HTH domain
MLKEHFDTEAFYAAIDAQRQAKKLNWKQVSTQSGVSASTLTRMAQGRRPDVDGLAALLAWSGLDIDTFIGNQEQKHGESETLTMISTYLRSDPHLSPESAKALDELIKATYQHLRKDK